MCDDDSRMLTALDKQLATLAQVAQSHPPRSRERQRSLTRLMIQLHQSKKLLRPQRHLFQGFYEEVYAEALQRLNIYICDRIETYSPDKGTVLQWVNFLLSRRFFNEASREFLPVLPRGLDPKTVKRLTLDDLDHYMVLNVNDPNHQSLAQQVYRYIDHDPRGVFQSTYIADYPQATFQAIALRRLDGYSWQEISQEWSMPISTLSSFYQRCLKKFTDQFREDLL